NLVLVDEAHHVPARTWRGALDAFDSARQLLFTATPFRRDEKEIHGKLIYVYSVREAYADGIFSDISFEAVFPAEGQSSDLAIAKAAEAAMKSDRAAGFNHRLMVRTDRKNRAAELQELYSRNTELNLRSINSNHSLRHINRVIRQLKAGELDGVICVDMLGEGFDLPMLKLAAVHSPHRSLEVTLQFIGRFARAGEERLGEARFFAVPAEIEAETDRLYREGAIWGQMVHNLSQGRIKRELRIREALGRFRAPDLVSEETMDISLAALRPYFHVKVYQVANDIDISNSVEFDEKLEVIYRTYSENDGTAVFITRGIERPRWTTLDEFSRIQYDLFVVVWDSESRLLFINSSIRSTAVYEAVAEAYTAGAHQILPLTRVNRVLAEISDTEFFNVGMRNALPNSPTESYRIIAGPRADEAIQRTDGRLFHRGHVFGKGIAGDGQVTIGYSSASKVWSNKNALIPELVAWCRLLARKISSDQQPRPTQSGLDNLGVGEEIQSIPAHPVIAADWNESAYKSDLAARYQFPDGGYRDAQLVDFRLEVDRQGVTDSSIPFAIIGDGFNARGTFVLQGGQFRYELDTDAQRIRLSKRDEGVGLADWLRNHPIDFYLADFSRLRGVELFCAQADWSPFDRGKILAINWLAANVDIRREAGPGPGISIHEFLKRELIGRGEGVVIYDHRTGEVADFIRLRVTDHGGEVEFYHVKSSSGDAPGDRVSDVYEVCGQVVRSPRWFFDLPRLRERLIHRLASGSTLAFGTR
ncbi:MAG: DEAD/DEAH box helicase, partial [Candidatus Thorarchaeota archaeon]